MVAAWLEREKGLVEDTAALREFSEVLAVDIFLKREARKMERVAKSELEPLAAGHGISMEDWQLSGRSLLNRDAVGNYKFAHRSIMEYLFAKRFAAGKVQAHHQPWTDQINFFFLELLVNGQPVSVYGPAG